MPSSGETAITKAPPATSGADHETGEEPCPPRSSSPTTAPPTRTTPSPSAASSPAPAPRSSLAYVRHTHEPDSDRETLAQDEAEELLDRGAAAARRRRGRPPRRHRPLDARGPAGARRARGRRRDRVLLGLAHGQGPRRGRQLGRAPARGRPHGGRDRAGRPRRAARRRPACGRSSRSATPTAARARPPSRSPRALGATVAPVANDETRPARDRLAPRGGAGADLDQLLRLPPDRDRHLPGAGAASRRRARLRQDAGRSGRLSGQHRRAGATGRAERAPLSGATVGAPAPGDAGRAPARSSAPPSRWPERARPQPGLRALGPAGNATGAHGAARYRGGRARRRQDHRHRARRTRACGSQVQVPPSEVEGRLERKAQQLGRELKLPGFRRGKVPAPLVIQRIGREAILEEAVRDTLSSWYSDAIETAGIVPVGDPQLDLGDLAAAGRGARVLDRDRRAAQGRARRRTRASRSPRREPAVEEEQIQQRDRGACASAWRGCETAERAAARGRLRRDRLRRLAGRAETAMRAARLRLRAVRRAARVATSSWSWAAAT